MKWVVGNGVSNDLIGIEVLVVVGWWECLTRQWYLRVGGGRGQPRDPGATRA